MATSTIQLRRSALSGKVPETGSLALGEIAINTYDGKIFFKKSGSIESIEGIVTTNSITTGSITILGTGSFGVVNGEIRANNGVVSGSSQIISILDPLNQFSSSLNLFTSSQFVSNSFFATTGSNTFRNDQIISGSVGITNDLTVLGTVNARQFNINIISSSTIYESGSSNFGNTGDDIHTFTGSVRISGSLLFNEKIVPTLTISDTTPTGIQTGSLWYDEDSGKTYVYYDNNTTSSWVLLSDPTLDVNSSLQTLQEVTDLGNVTDNAIVITNTTPSTGVTSGALIVSGGVGISGSVYGGKFYGDGSGLTGITATYTETDTLESVIGRGNSTSGSIIITSTTNATSKTTGNLRTAGGLGVEKDIWANNLYITNEISGSSVTGSFTGSFKGDGSELTGIAGTNTFATIAVSGQSNVVADSSSDTLTLVAGSNVTITTDAGTDTITIASTGGSGGNTFATFSVAGQNNVIADTTSDTVTLTAGSGITITTDDTTDTITFTSTAANNTFATFSVAGQNNVIADSATDTLTLVAGSNITITTNDTTDTITIASTGGSGGNTFATFSVAGQNDVIADAGSDTLTLAAGSGITITTDDTTDTITFTSTGGGGTFPYTGSAIISGSLSVTGSSSVLGSGSRIFVVSGSTGGLMEIGDGGTDEVFSIGSGSVDIFRIQSNKAVAISGSLIVTGSITGSLFGTASNAVSSSYALTASYALNASAGGNTFATFSVAGQNDVIADVTSDTLTLVAGSNITITTDNTTDSITIASTAGGGSSNPVVSSGVSIADPTNAEDVTMLYTSESITIQRVNAVLRGSGGQSATITLRYDSDRSAAGTAIVSAQAVTSITTATSVTLTANTTVPANNFIWLETTATAGTVNELFVGLSYTV